MLIVLNGASSSGKTTTAHALAQRLGPNTVITGLDEVLARVRPFGPEQPRGLGHLARALRVLWFNLTDGRWRLFEQIWSEAAAQANAGTAVIVEVALMEPRLLRAAAARLAPLGGLLVGLRPPLAVAEQWEARRGDRPAGQARKHHQVVHAHGVYDLVLDPSGLTPDECAAAIVERWESGPATAFSRLLADGAA